MKFWRTVTAGLALMLAAVWTSTTPAQAADAWALKKNCPTNTHLVVKYTVKANKNGGLWVGRSMYMMQQNNVQVSWSKDYARKMSYNTGMNGGMVWWGHGTGAWKGSIVDGSSYGICVAGV